MVDPISAEALNGLATALAELLEGESALDPAPLVTVHPLRFASVGLGGLADINQDPPGEILGRRIEATVVVTARSESAALAALSSQVSQRLLTASRKERAEKGLLDIRLQELGPEKESQQPFEAQQDLRFQVLYEFLKQPEEPQGLITEFPLTERPDGSLEVVLPFRIGE